MYILSVYMTYLVFFIWLVLFEHNKTDQHIYDYTHECVVFNKRYIRIVAINVYGLICISHSMVKNVSRFTIWIDNIISAEQRNTDRGRRKDYFIGSFVVSRCLIQGGHKLDWEFRNWILCKILILRYQLNDRLLVLLPKFADIWR